MTQGDQPFRMETVENGGGRVTVTLFGELDIVSAPEFDAQLKSRAVREAREITFDITCADFISAQGFTEIGRCSFRAERVVVRSRTSFASKVLQACGFDRPVCVVAPR